MKTDQNNHEQNPFAVSTTQRSVQSIDPVSGMMASRAAQEVQAAMIIAKKFPRDQMRAYDQVMLACKRKGLAEEAIYSYPKGGTKVEGPSIRLAEALAQSWGNMDFGIIELEQSRGESHVMAYAWDLETNSRQTKVFTVAHARKANGSIKALDDPREIYEMVANQGARRLRSCILGVIPGDLVDAAVNECNKTLKSGGGEPLIDRIKKMAAAFGDQFSVSIAMIEERIGHKLEATSETELAKLRKIFVSMKDGMSKREDWFNVSPAANADNEKPNISAASEKDAKDEKSEADMGLAPDQGKEPAKKTSSGKAEPKPNDPPKNKQGESPRESEPTPGPAESNPEEMNLPKESVADLMKLAQLLGSIGVGEDQFIAWMKYTKFFTTPIESVDALAELSPKKLAFLVNNFEEKFKASIQEFTAKG